MPDPVAALEFNPAAKRIFGVDAPGWFDPQINGYGGNDFSAIDLTPEQVASAARRIVAGGVASFFATVITCADEARLNALQAIRSARDLFPDVASAIPGIHLEGPWISPEDGYRGAHPLRHVREPDLAAFARWQEAAGGLVRLVTLAPEWQTGVDAVAGLVKQGVGVAAGHSAATPKRLGAAVSEGLGGWTHLGNGCPSWIPRHNHCMWAVLEDDRLYASVIADGVHLPPEMLRAVVNAKGARGTVLTCDASPLAGSAPGRYRLWGREVDHDGAAVRLAGTGYLAGSALLTGECFARLAAIMGTAAMGGRPENA